MVFYKDLEYFDKVNDTESIFWVEVSGVPKKFVSEAKMIDSTNYSADCFGVCIQHDRETGKFAAIEDTPGYTLYYVDNKGEKYWFDYRLSKQELKQITTKICDFFETMETHNDRYKENSCEDAEKER